MKVHACQRARTAARTRCSVNDELPGRLTLGALADQGWLGADFDSSGATNFADFVILSNHYGQSIAGNAFIATPDELAVFPAAMAEFSAGTTIPEPSTLSLILLAIVPFHRRHCH